MKKILNRKRNESQEGEIRNHLRKGAKETENCPVCGCDLVNREGKKVCTHRNCLYSETD